MSEINTIEISDDNELIILQLMSFIYCNQSNAVEKIKNLDMDNIDQVITIGNFQYKITCIIVHEGNSSQEGHYYLLVNNVVDWIKINDAMVDRQPMSCVVRNPYVIVLEKITWRSERKREVKSLLKYLINKIGRNKFNSFE